MLRMDNLFENFDLARQCLGFWVYDEATAAQDFQYFRVSSNAVYPFRRNGRYCFLRMAPAEEKDAEAVESEIEILNWLRGQGFPAMEPIPARDGSFLKTANTQWGRYLVSCFYRVPGWDLESTEFDLHCEEGIAALLLAAQRYGACLGKLHSTLMTCPLPHHRRSHTAMLAHARQRLEQYGAPDYMLREWEALCRKLDALPTGPEEYGLVHYDFEADNVFYDSKTGSLSVIDFDDMITCWYALDVVRALDCMDDVAGGKDMGEEQLKAITDRACDAFLAGYRSQKQFTPEQEASLPLMRRLVRICEYAGLLYTLSGVAAQEPEWMTQLREKLTGECLGMERSVVNS